MGKNCGFVFCDFRFVVVLCVFFVYIGLLRNLLIILVCSKVIFVIFGTIGGLFRLEM